ncbi:MFS transporter [Borrelia crocidurae]|uniref:Multidrug-efflux transporter n=1 Tax=Borrelia crocidurae (strain Achema) TaxID=1155096 RepID=I0FES8_BORCA|nr:MFS transporter [Borrelia crocidurae]AFI31984.1 Multidrug-efflux transporter [Borrelia crocidurae str. Achema]
MIEDTHQRYYFYSLFLSEFARTLPHAVLTIILINKGLQLRDIAIVQMFYMLAIIFFELPSGIISDIFDRKIVYLSSIFLSMIAYFFIFQTSSFIMLCIAWFVYGVSSAVNTGTIDISFTHIYQNNSKKLKAFISSMKIILSTGAILGGYAGSILFLYIDKNIYLFSLFLYLVSSLITIFFISNDKNTDYNKENISLYLKQFKKNIIILLRSKIFIELLILISSIQFFFQPFYLYWQAIFIDKNVPISIFGIIYILFRFSNIVGAWIFKKIRHSRYDSYVILSIIFLLSILTKIISYTYMFVTIITLLVILVSLYSNNLEYFLRKNIDSKILGTITSINSTISRLFSFLVLISCSVLASFTSIINTFILLILIFCILSIIVTYKFMDNKKEYTE